MNNIFRIAIDGPGGAGKSTIAKAVAKKLNIDYIDTGAMYRAIGFKIISQKISLDDEAGLACMLKSTEIDFSKGRTILDGEDVSDKIRTPAMSQMASACSALAVVREKLVLLQRKMGQTKSVIMDGRDIGTNVLTDAEYKFYMTASPEERAGRRFKELTEKGEKTSFEQVLLDINQRDYNDTTRALNPLKKADDAVELDTTGLSIEDVTNLILKEIEKDGNC